MGISPVDGLSPHFGISTRAGISSEDNGISSAGEPGALLLEADESYLLQEDGSSLILLE